MRTIIACLFLFFAMNALAQEPEYYAETDLEMQQKYWKYRDQLKKSFMKIGLDNGESLPCRARNYGYFLGQGNPFPPGSSVPMKSPVPANLAQRNPWF